MRHIIAGGLLALAVPLAAQAHGYLSAPESRSLLCKQGVNASCGAIQYEPQSLEASSGYPAKGPADGRIASAGLTQFGELDEQTSTRWAKRSVKAGPQTFTWTFTANHATREWRYYLTRADWNPNQKLSRASFEATPFCQVNGGNVQPPKTVTHACTLPARTGYQLVLAVWEVADTPNSFYNLLDLQFDGTTPGYTWSAKGSIFPNVDLAVGDRALTRVFDAKGERSEWSTRLTVATASDGARTTWPFLLAGRINAEQTLLKAGQKAADGSINPAYGANDVFARNDSGIERVEIQVDKAPPPPPELKLGGLAAEYQPGADGAVQLALTLSASVPVDATATVFDAAGVSKASASLALGTGSTPLSLSVPKAVPGSHQLVVKGQAKSGGATVQQTWTFNVRAAGTPAYDQVFPAGLSAYKAGTRVLQNKTGRVYECKPEPYAGWCRVWSASNTAYEPGVGAAWADAWILR